MHSSGLLAKSSRKLGQAEADQVNLAGRRDYNVRSNVSVTTCFIPAAPYHHGHCDLFIIHRCVPFPSTMAFSRF